MRYTRVYLHAMGYELPPNVVSSEELEERLEPVYRALRLRTGQLEALTGIRERRWWNPGAAPSDGAIKAARKALAVSKIRPEEIGCVVYGGVCRDNFEPATACRVAAELGVSGAAEIYDVSNACLGMLNGIVDIANRIELGQIRAGLAVSCETAREINDVMIAQMNADPSMEMFKLSMATLTGGSGAAAFLLTDGTFGEDRPRLLGGALRSAPEHHALCRWGEDRRTPALAPQYFETDAIPVLKNGVALGVDTWRDLLSELRSGADDFAKVILHQVGASNRDAILRAIGVAPEREFSSFEFLGNMGTVALPITAALAAERGFLAPGDRVGFLGIGSGLNCLMLGWEWR